MALRNSINSPDLEHAVKLHSVNGRHEGCGVCALSALTGLSTGDIAAQIMSKRVEQGTEQYEQQMVARFGEKLAALWLDKRVPVTHKYESSHILEQFFNVEISWAHQLLETWLESHARPDDPAGYLIEIPGHVMALAGGKVVDNTWRKPTAIDNKMLAFMRILGEEGGAAVSKDPLYVDEVLKCTPK